MEWKLKLLLKMSAELTGEKDFQTSLVKLSELTKTLLNADICSIFIHESRKKQLWSLISYYVDRITIDEKSGIIGHVFQTGETVNIDDAYRDPRFDFQVDRETGYRTKNILAIPIINSRKEKLGVVEVINKLSGSHFSRDDVELLKHIIFYISSIFDNNILYRKLKRAQEEIVYKLSNVTRYKDPETENHILRVGLYAQLMAKTLKLDKEDVELLKLAASMHDIGKIGIPDSILLKHDRLTEEEMQTMKEHTRIGYDILKGGDSRLSEIASIIAMEHHERWDGTGYPDGKKAEEISLFGRITAIADYFDALTSRRPYKEAWTFESAIESISSKRGSYFDPELTDLFLNNIEHFIEIKNSYSD